MTPSESEVSVYDFQIQIESEDKPVYVNIKSAVKGARKNKDDISKAIGLKGFYDEDPEKEIFIASFVIDFKDNMSIEIEDCHVMYSEPGRRASTRRPEPYSCTGTL